MGRSALRAAALVVLMFLLHGCSSLQGRVTDGSYTPADGEFTVQVPTSADFSCHDGIDIHLEFVDCAVGGGYWMGGGGYSLEWYKLTGPGEEDAKFYMDAPRLMPQLAATQGADNFSIVSTERLTVNGHSAYQAVARGVKDKIQAYWVGTTINFGNRIATAILIVPANNPPYTGPDSAEQAATWGFYPKFVASVQDHAAQP